MWGTVKVGFTAHASQWKLMAFSLKGKWSNFKYGYKTYFYKSQNFVSSIKAQVRIRRFGFKM